MKNNSKLFGYQGKKLSMAKLILCSILSTCVMGSVSTQTASPLAEGQITFDDHVMEIKSAVATWNSERNWLQIEFFPFELTEEEVSVVQTQSPLMPVLKRSRSDETIKQLFTANCVLQFNEPITELQSEGIKQYSIGIFNIGNAQIGMAFARSLDKGEALIKKLKGVPQDGSAIEIEFSGRYNKKHTVTWNFKLRSVTAIRNTP